MNRLRRFASESWSELKKVTWPSRIQVRNLTVLVFVVSFVVGLFITVVDSGFDFIIRALADLA
ncbi:MAG TPA: preprotein translocase subunit SecE [Candidatus Limnocylindrales bacterium]|nr:preprotein translocase subunit SecE [Candidatus Limnocylindrales bacterium]